MEVLLERHVPPEMTAYNQFGHFRGGHPEFGARSGRHTPEMPNYINWSLPGRSGASPVYPGRFTASRERSGLQAFPTGDRAALVGSANSVVLCPVHLREGSKSAASISFVLPAGLRLVELFDSSRNDQ